MEEFEEKNEQKDVFISYSTKDAELAQYLCSLLEGRGVTCWIAPRDIHGAVDWGGAIVAGLKAAKVFALLLSEASMASPEVPKEVTLANKFGLKILPIRIENVALKGSFDYHLANVQWVDALDIDKQKRFADAVPAILKPLKRADATIDAAAGSIPAEARELVDQLNESASVRLAVVNAMYSLRKASENTIEIFFPLRIGATGIDLIFTFDGESNGMEIYADAASIGDPLKKPFIDLMEREFKQYFPRFQSKTKMKKYRFLQLVPKVKPPSALIEARQEEAFDLFKKNVLAFSEKVMPRILDWAEYARELGHALRDLEDKLKGLFPEDDGWRVGAPDVCRLDGFRPQGRISVYKAAWAPGDDYRGRGLLSITLESKGAFLNDLRVGIQKYEDWLDLGDWQGTLAAECSALQPLAAEASVSEGFWVWQQSLGDGFSDSGLGEADARWRGKLDAFVAHCLDKFRAMKALETLMEGACTSLLTRPVRDPGSFTEEQRTWRHGPYIENWLKKISADLAAVVGPKGFAADYRFRMSEPWRDVRFMFRVGGFDAAIVFRCSAHEWRVEVCSAEPPDFETPIVQDFLARRYGYNKITKISGGLLMNTQRFREALDGGTAEEWMRRFAAYVSGRAADLLPAICDLKRHLERVVDVAAFAAQELQAVLPAADGWEIENRALTLEASRGILICHGSWRGDAMQGNVPIVGVEIVPDSPCFDDLSLTVQLFAPPVPGLERHLGTICGAFDFAFGPGDEREQTVLWKRELDPPFCRTGGQHFEEPLLDGERKEAFGQYLRGLAEKMKQLNPIVEKACSRKRELDFSAAFDAFFDQTAKRVQAQFPEGEGWVMETKKDVGTRGGISIRFFKKAWQDAGKSGPSLCLALEGEGENFYDLRYGIMRLSRNSLTDYAEKIRERVTQEAGDGSGDKLWLWCKVPDQETFRKTGGADRLFVQGDRFEELLDFYSGEFAKLKKASEIIDGYAAKESHATSTA